MALRRLAPNEVLMREGEEGETFALIVEGDVAVTRGDGRQCRLLARAGPGSILGELAVLRHQPRTATVTALTPTVAAIGNADVLLDLADREPVLARLRRLTSARLAHNVRPVPATLHSGVRVRLRPLLPEDRGGFRDAVRSLSADSRRRRFFSAGRPSAAMVDHLVDIDFVDHFAWVAVLDGSPEEGVATGRYIRDEPNGAAAEMAFGVVDRFHGRGIGTLLFGAVGVAARESGIRTLYGHVLQDNLPMRAVFAKAGGRASFAEPGVLRIEVDPDAAAAMLDAALGDALRAAAHDVVTAASLPLSSPPGSV
jgi:CRP-like cAMP-binding protein